MQCHALQLFTQNMYKMLKLLLTYTLNMPHKTPKVIFKTLVVSEVQNHPYAIEETVYRLL